MSRLSQSLLVVLAAALAGHLAVIHLLPGFIMSVAMERISAGAAETAARQLEDGSALRPDQNRAVTARAGWNAPIPAPRADHTQRYVVRSSADILYSACVFDLAAGPVRVTAPQTGGYASISAFAANTDNFFVLDDREATGETLSVVLHRPDQATAASAPGPRTAAPSQKGIVLVRYLIEDEADLPDYVEKQSRITCGPL